MRGIGEEGVHAPGGTAFRLLSRVDDRGCFEFILWILRTGARRKNQLMPGEALVARSQPYYGDVGAFAAQQLHVHRSSSATSARRRRPTCASRTTSCLTSTIAVMRPVEGRRREGLRVGHHRGMAEDGLSNSGLWH